MAKQSLSIPMSQIIAADAPLLSPVDAAQHWENSLLSPVPDNFTYAYYNLSEPPLADTHRAAPSPPAAAMLRMRMTPEPACLPTHQVFDFPEVARPPTPPSRSPSAVATQDSTTVAATIAAVGAAYADDDDNDSSCGSKRSGSMEPPVAKKRAVGERVSSKDFIPPDVTGLSKREARLVKNRAAAFLSRQRKREEFECMEIRVAELEQENKRLLALTQNGSTPATQAAPLPTEDNLMSEVELLKAQLAAAQERERTLSAQLATAAPISTPAVKVEASESHFSLSSPPRSSSAMVSAHKSSASLGLMVLLCALPSLLSMRMQSPASASANFAISNPFRASSAFDNNMFLSNDYDWSKAGSGSLMDLDDQPSDSSATQTKGMRKLEFTGVDSTEMGGLGDLDISFDTAPSDDGKIRVRIHPHPSSSATSSRSASRGVTPLSDNGDHDMSSSSSASDVPSAISSSASLSAPTSTQTSSPLTTSSSDPFLGVTSETDFGMMGMGMGMSMGGPFASDGSLDLDSLYSGMAGDLLASPLSEASFKLGSEYSVPDSTSSTGKRRVRIALKSMPQAGGEGGEWEVQIC